MVAIENEFRVSQQMELTETRIISNAQKEFSAWLQRLGVEDDYQKRTDKITGQEDFTRIFVSDFIHHQQDSFSDEHIEEVITSCKKRWKLKDEDLDMGLDPNGQRAQGSSYTLRDVLTKLSQICVNQLQSQAALLQKLSSPTRLSEEACGLYKKSCSLYGKLEQSFNSHSFVICSSSRLPDYIGNAIRQWHSIPDNHGTVSKKSCDLPEYFYFKKITEDVSEKENPRFDTIRQELCSIYSIYRQKLGHNITSGTVLEPNINKILALSLMEVFAIHEEDEAPTLAPVISYLVFRHRYLRNESEEKPLTKFPIRILTELQEPERDPLHMECNLCLYRELRKVYEKYYKCSQAILEAYQ